MNRLTQRLNEREREFQRREMALVAELEKIPGVSRDEARRQAHRIITEQMRGEWQ